MYAIGAILCHQYGTSVQFCVVRWVSRQVDGPGPPQNFLHYLYGFMPFWVLPLWSGLLKTISAMACNPYIRGSKLAEHSVARVGERTFTIFDIYQCPLKHGHAPFLHLSASPFLCFDSTTPNSWEAAWATVMYRGGSYTLRPLQEYIDPVATVSTTKNSIAHATSRCIYTVLWHAAIGFRVSVYSSARVK